MGGNFIKRALASCWRVSLLLLIGFSLLGSWLYFQAPSLNSVRPTIENHLKEKLELKEIKLGTLSWSWSGFLWLESDQLNFASSDEALAYRDGGVAIRIPLSGLLTGNFNPDHIRLSGGALNLKHTQSGRSFPVAQLVLDDVVLNWHYQDQWEGTIEHLQLFLDGDNMALEASSPDFELSGRLGEDMLPQSLSLECEHLGWMPAPIQKHLSGKPTAKVNLKRLNRRIWQLDASMASDSTITLLPETIYSVQLNRAELKLKLKAQKTEAFAIEHIGLEQVLWSLGESSIQANGNWNAGLLSLQASSEQLAIPVVWSWLRPLGDEEWHHWLSLMKSGTGRNAKAKVSLVWDNPLEALPAMENWEAMLFQVSAHVDGADIALGLSDDFLSDATAEVDLNQDGLNAIFSDAQLPRNLGRSTGELYIPWQTLELHIAGKSKVDVESLLSWFGPDQISNWQWNGARADSSFQLLWDPSESEPREATAKLHASENWNVTIHGTPIQLSKGIADWDQESGLTIKDMQFKNEHVMGSLDLSTAIDKENKWKITHLQSRSTSDFALLAAHFQLPLSQAGGTIHTNLNFDGRWSGSIDMGATSWKQLLGSSKRSGEPYRINYRGKLNFDQKIPTLDLTTLNSSGKALLISNSSASINRKHLKLKLNDLHTPSFIGSLDITVPFDDKPWELATNALYLNRKALPEALDHPSQMIDKPWVVSANIAKFDWDDSRMKDVFIRLASTKGSIGLFKARQVHTTQLDITDIDARFSMPGGGTIDLRRLSASLEKQRLIMSATLKPEKGGGMRWSGFSELHGDFGHLLKLGKLSERFEGGDGHLLFSGSGIILREQPWWDGLDGRLRLRSDNGRILEGGTLTTLLAAINLTELPMLLLGQREDLTGPGTMYERLQMEAIMQDQKIHVRNVAMRSTAFDLAGHGEMNLEKTTVDLYLVVQPLQNLDALLAKIPLIRDILGGRSHSLIRKVYHMHGPFTDAKVEAVKPEKAGLASPGIIEHLFNLPDLWFNRDKDQPEEIKPETFPVQ